MSLNCPLCYNWRTMEKAKCYYCDKVAEFTQPDADTGKIIDVCKNHFTWMHVG